MSFSFYGDETDSQWNLRSGTLFYYYIKAKLSECGIIKVTKCHFNTSVFNNYQEHTREEMRF